jgi:hypothetical protein
MARCASLSFARFLASCSGVRLATPREVAGPALRLLFKWPVDEGVVASVGDAVSRSFGPGTDIGKWESRRAHRHRDTGDPARSTQSMSTSCATIRSGLDVNSHVLQHVLSMRVMKLVAGDGIIPLFTATLRFQINEGLGTKEVQNLQLIEHCSSIIDSNSRSDSRILLNISTYNFLLHQSGILSS